MYAIPLYRRLTAAIQRYADVDYATAIRCLWAWRHDRQAPARIEELGGPEHVITAAIQRRHEGESG